MSGGQEPQDQTRNAGVEWYLAREGQQYGPLSHAEMVKLVELGHLKAVDLVWRAGFSDWTQAVTAFPELGAAAKPPPPPPPPPPQRAPAPAGAADGASRTTAGSDGAPEPREPAQSRARPSASADPAHAPDQSKPAADPDQRRRAQERQAAPAEAPRRQVTEPAWAAAGPRQRPAARADAPASETAGGADIAWPDAGARTPDPHGQAAAASRPAPSWPGAGPVPQGVVQAAGPQARGAPQNAPPGAHRTPQPGNQSRHGQSAMQPARYGDAYPDAPGAAGPSPAAGRAPHHGGPHSGAPAPNWSLDGAAEMAPQTTGGRRRSGRPRSDPDLSEPGPIAEEEHYEGERRGRGGLVLMLVLVLLLGVAGAGAYGVYTGRISADWADDLRSKLGLAAPAPQQATRSPLSTDAGSRAGPPSVAAAAPAPSAATATSAGAGGPAFPPTAAAFDSQLQTSKMWQMVKTDFPAWYQERIKEGARRSAESQDGASIQRYLLESLVALRRENARHAYAAGLPNLQAIAEAFRNNLVNLAQNSESACYTFISRGESARAIAQLYHQPRFGPLLEAQMVAVLEGFRQGQRQPITMPQPRQEDYALLSTELKTIGWTDDDLKLFADADGLARTEPAKVCSMVTDWFSAHLKLKDGEVQGRLLAESIRPVVGG